MRVFLTGGAGFIGGAVARKLLSAEHQVRALTRLESDTQQLKGLEIEQIAGDLGDDKSLERGMAGCDWVFHVAALYSYWGHPWKHFYQTNVEGTRRVMEAARKTRVKRVVYTSSIATLGLNEDRTPSDEQVPSSLADRIGPYQRSKFLAEVIVSEFADQGLPIVIVNPSTPVGVGDHKPTPTGQIIVDYLNGRFFGYVDSGLNIVDVEDVATGHLLAAERGQIGQRYILGGENMTLKQLLDLLAELSGGPKVNMRIPHWLALAWSYLDVALARLNPTHLPAATPEKVRLSHHYEFFDSGKAIKELGLPHTPVQEALRKSIEWYRTNGYVP